MGNVTGLKNVLAMLRRSQSNKPRQLERGLVKAGLVLQRASMRQVPVDTGNLRNTAFTRKAYAFNTVAVTVGYTATYAVYVHEVLWTRHKKGKKAKFLEGPFRAMRNELLQIVKDELKKD